MAALSTGEALSPTNVTDKIIMITGATRGIGQATAEALVQHNPTHMYLLCRDLNKGEVVSTKLRKKAPNVLVTIIHCDLSSFDSIREAASRFSLLTPRLDILICNAGVYTPNPGLTQDGFEIHLGVNHLGHALLIKLLLPTLHRTGLAPNSVRIIFVSSWEHRWTARKGIAFDDLKTTQSNLSYKWRYGQSKLANILYAREMAKRYPDITVVSVNPGHVGTDRGEAAKRRYLHSDWLMRCFSRISTFVYRGLGLQRRTPEEGSRIVIWSAAVASDELVSGEYYDAPHLLGNRTAFASHDILQLHLWAWTQGIVTEVPFDENTVRE